jgi:hypothetical protein
MQKKRRKRKRKRKNGTRERALGSWRPTETHAKKDR